MNTEAEMQSILQSVPHTPYGTVRLRGQMGIPAVMEDTGLNDDEGNPIFEEMTPAIIYDGYFVELFLDELPAELEKYRWAG